MYKEKFFKKNSNIFNYIATILICMFPILAPYKFLGPFSIGLSLIVIIGIIQIIRNKSIVFNLPFMLLIFTHSILSMVAYFTVPYNSGIVSIISSFIVISIISISMCQIIPLHDKKYFYKVMKFLAILCCLFLIYQIIIISHGNIPNDGRLFENLTDGYTWSRSVTYRRPNSVFAEPSYFSIYILPVLVMSLINKEFIIASFFIGTLFLSTSSLGIIASILIILFYCVIKQNYKVFLYISIFIIFIPIILNIFNLDWIITSNLNKISNLSEESSIRISGYLDYFKKLPAINQMIGVGFNQLSNYFREYGLYNYSNTWVLVLINHGIVGMFLYILFLVYLFIKVNSNGKIFVILFLIVSSVDSILYNANFYYLLIYIFFNVKYYDTDIAIEKLKII